MSSIHITILKLIGTTKENVYCLLFETVHEHNK